MVKKLHLVPIKHNVPSDILSNVAFRGNPDIKEMVEANEISVYKTMLSTLSKLFIDLIDEPVNAIFYEGAFRNYDPSKAIPLNAFAKGILEFAKCNGAKIEKTEDKIYWYSDAAVSNFSFFYIRYLPQIPLIDKIIKWAGEVFRKRRDYSIAKHATRGMGENDIRILFYGKQHKLETYVRNLSPETELILHQ
jgi:hypothetical protein